MVKLVWILPPLLIFGLVIATAVPGMAASPGIKAIVAGYDCSFAVKDDGTLWAWGDNEYGQLGDGTNTDRSTPEQVPIDDVKAVACGSAFTLALKNDGTVWAWGDNRYGQLGDGTNVSSYVPRCVPGLLGVKAIAARDYHVSALMEDGTVREWGLGGRDHIVARPETVDITDVTAIGCGVALKADGSVWSWDYDEVVGGILYKFKPARVPISNVTAIGGNNECTLALKDDGTVWGWGNNGGYQLGNVTTDYDQPTPVKVDRLENASFITTGGGVSFALMRDGRALSWGRSSSGMLGIGHYGTDIVQMPSPLLNMTGVRAISAGNGHGLAVKNDGTVWAWGANDKGQLGNGVNESTYNLKFYYSNGTVVNLKSYYSNGTVVNDCSPAPYFYSEPIPVQIFVGEGQATSNHTSRLPLPVQATAPVPEQTPRPAGVNVTSSDIWGFDSGKPVQYLTNDEDGNIYAFGRNDVRCISRDGTLKWSLTIPDQWVVCKNRNRIDMVDMGGVYTAGSTPMPVYSLSNGTLYLYAEPNMTYTPLPGWYDDYTDAAASGKGWVVMAVSSEGKISWTYQLDMFPKKVDDTFIGAMEDRVYVFHGYTETVLDKNGKKLFDLQNVASPAAVDENGDIYVVDAVVRHWGAGRIDGDQFADFRMPGRTIRAYGPNGMLLWQKDVGDYIQWNYVLEGLRSKYGTVPIYQNGTLYVFVRSGVVALDSNGNEKWSRILESGSYQPFPLMPIDSMGNAYLEGQDFNDFDFTHDVYVVGDDGKYLSPPRKYVRDGPYDATARNGIIYDVSYDTYSDLYGWPTSVDNLTTFTIRAYDIVNDSVLWAYTIPSDKKSSVIIDHNNLYSLFGGTMEDWKLKAIDAQIPGVQEHTRPIEPDNRISMYLDGNTLYVIAHVANYESPIILGQSKCVYTSGLYVINTNGDLAYEKPLSRMVTVAMVNNSTVFFGTYDGGLSAVTLGAVAGLAFLTVAGILAKFFLFGTVTRARSRLDKNENRNLVLSYIKGHPGSTIYEVSRGTGINMGTLRYHVFILSHNHRIVAFKEGKFIRYFPNSNFYSKEEQLIISLMRREPVKNTLKLLIERSGISSLEFSLEFNQSTTATYNTMNELLGLGIVEKGPNTDRGYAYYIKEEYRELVKKRMDQV